MCCPRSSQINIRQSQTLPNIKRDQYKQLSCQPKPSQASPDASDRASEDPRFSTFWKSVKWLWPPEAQLSTSPQASMTKFGWILYVLTALGQNMRSLTWKMAEPQSLPAFFPIIISAQGRMVCWVGLFRLQIFQRDFAPFSTIDTSKHQQRPIQTTFQSTKTIPGVPRRLWPSFRKSNILKELLIDPFRLNMKPPLLTFLTWTDSSRHFQSSNWTNTSNFSIDWNHPGRHQMPLTELQKVQDFKYFESGQVTRLH